MAMVFLIVVGFGLLSACLSDTGAGIVGLLILLGLVLLAL